MEESVGKGKREKDINMCKCGRQPLIDRSGSTWHRSSATEHGLILVGGAGIPISRDREIWKFPSSSSHPSVCWPAGKGRCGRNPSFFLLVFLWPFRIRFLPLPFDSFRGSGFSPWTLWLQRCDLSRRSRPCSTDASGLDPERGGSRLRLSIKTAPAPVHWAGRPVLVSRSDGSFRL